MRTANSCFGPETLLLVAAVALVVLATGCGSGPNAEESLAFADDAASIGRAVNEAGASAVAIQEASGRLGQGKYSNRTTALLRTEIPRRLRQLYEPTHVVKMPRRGPSVETRRWSERRVF